MASFHHAHHQHGHTDHQATRVDYKHDEAVQSTCPEIAKKIIISNGLYNDLNLLYSLIKEVIFSESMRIHLTVNLTIKLTVRNLKILPSAEFQ